MNSKYILYIKKNCPFCIRAVELLESQCISFSTVAFDNRLRVLQEMKDVYEWNTVPMVFRKDGNQIEFIGGFSDLSERLSNG